MTTVDHGATIRQVLAAFHITVIGGVHVAHRLYNDRPRVVYKYAIEPMTWRGRALKNPHAKLHDMEKALGAHGIQCSMTWGKDSAGREELRITLVPTGETR